MEVLFLETVWSASYVEDHNLDDLISAIKANGGTIPEDWFDEKLSPKEEVWDTSKLIAPDEVGGTPTVIIRDNEGEEVWANSVESEPLSSRVEEAIRTMKWIKGVDEAALRHEQNNLNSSRWVDTDHDSKAVLHGRIEAMRKAIQILEEL